MGRCEPGSDLRAALAMAAAVAVAAVRRAASTEKI
jgi:hypothetical protein